MDQRGSVTVSSRGQGCNPGEDRFAAAAQSGETGAAGYEKGKLYHLSLNDILVDPNQPRKVMEAAALEELAASIEKHGILEPILFRRQPDGNLMVVAGERRIAAARKAGLTSIPAMYVEGNPSEIALVENLLRQDLTAVEEAEALQLLLDQQKYTHEQLSRVIGKARTTISDILLINRLPLEIREDCRGDRTVSKNFLIEISRKKQERAMLTAYSRYRQKSHGRRRSRRENGDADCATVPASVVAMVERLLNGIGSLDMSGWEEEDRRGLCRKLSALKDGIDALLSGPASSRPDRNLSAGGE
jgi:ParB family chromosome partitioning protein